jgi:DNA-binding IscR family transcriptional regulator
VDGSFLSALDVLETIVNGLRNAGVVGTRKERKDGNALFK